MISKKFVKLEEIVDSENLRNKLFKYIELITKTKLNNDNNKIIQYIYEMILVARAYRGQLVQTKIQFYFICAFFGVINNTDNYYATQISNCGTGKDRSLCYTKQNDAKTKIFDNSSCKVLELNRYPNILPYGQNTLTTDGLSINSLSIDGKKRMPCDYYTNGSRLEDFATGFEVYAIDGPENLETIKRFKQILKHYGIKRIVMLTKLMENGKPKCLDYIGNQITKSISIADNSTTLSIADNSTKLNNGFSEVSLILGKEYNFRLAEASKPPLYPRTARKSVVLGTTTTSSVLDKLPDLVKIPGRPDEEEAEEEEL